MRKSSSRPKPPGASAEADTDFKEAATLREALAGTEDLLREMDHRVKNNLQLIASVLQLQIRRTEAPKARRALLTVQQRLNAITTVHRRLFQGDPHGFDVAEFIRDLTPDLAASAGRDDLSVVLDLEPVVVPAASAAPLALVFSELLGNALKHAYPTGAAGRVRISLHPDGGACRIEVADEGSGLRGAPEGLGLTIARLLCQQMQASLSLDGSDGGLCAVVRAPARGVGTT